MLPIQIDTSAPTVRCSCGTMKAKIADDIKQIKMFIGDMCDSQIKVPPIFHKACDNTFTPSLIRDFFITFRMAGEKVEVLLVKIGCDGVTCDVATVL